MSDSSRRRGRLGRILESKLIRRVSFEEYRRRVREHYDGPAGALLATASLLSLHSPLAGRLLRRRRFDLRGCRRILDVGSGAGQILRHLLRCVDPAAEIVALDLSLQMLRRARRRLSAALARLRQCPLASASSTSALPPKGGGSANGAKGPGSHGNTVMHWCAADVTRLPLADASFDAVTCGWVIEHLPDPRRGLAEMARVLVPGGRLLLFATEDTLPGYLCSRTWKCRTYNRSQLEATCGEVGLAWKAQLWLSGLHRLLGLGGILVEAQKPPSAGNPAAGGRSSR